MTAEEVTDEDQYFVCVAEYNTITGYDAAVARAIEVSRHTGKVATIYKAITRMKIESTPKPSNAHWQYR